MSASYRWLILVRAVRDTNPNGGTAELGMGWRLTDWHGIVPSPQETQRLEADAAARFFDAFAVTATRVTVALIPYLPVDGGLLPWRDFAQALPEMAVRVAGEAGAENRA